jgi:hypothetical protein
VFLVAPYAEPLFLAFALTGWLAARRGQFVRAGVLIALASLVKVNGLFVLAAVLVEYAGQARRTGRPLLRRDGLALLSPLVSIGGYVIWLQGRTGDWSAWQHAQQHAWQRYWTAPWSSISMTWHRAFADPRGSDFRWAWRAELLAAVVGLVLLVVLVRMRRWAEAVYVLLAWGTLVTDGLFFSIPRSTLLLWPLWLLLARATLRRQWLQPVLLWCMAPLCLALTFAFVTHHWVN